MMVLLRFRSFCSPHFRKFYHRLTKFISKQDLWKYESVPSVKHGKEHKSKQQMIDWRRVTCIGGNGGDGVISFASIFANEFAGPDGGDGGNGGHVIFRACQNVKDLANIPTICRGKVGVKGQNNNRIGANAEHTFLDVPVGTVIRPWTLKDERLFRSSYGRKKNVNVDDVTVTDDSFTDENFCEQEIQNDNKKSSSLTEITTTMSKWFKGSPLADLSTEGQIYIGAHAGAGGKGNRFFVSSINTAPRMYEEGAKGEERMLLLEMKSIAQVGLVGFPNSGKSTLLRALSRARPKVAPYPFTTLHPHIGMIQYADMTQISVADIPGIIENSHKNYGLGLSFLRHIERCSCLLYIIDLTIDEPWLQLEHLKYELEQYRNGLSRRPSLILCNKVDVEEGKNNLHLWKKRLEQQGKTKSEVEIDLTSERVENLIAISADKREGITDLFTLIRFLVLDFKVETCKNNESDYSVKNI